MPLRQTGVSIRFTAQQKLSRGHTYAEVAYACQAGKLIKSAGSCRCILATTDLLVPSINVAQTSIVEEAEQILTSLGVKIESPSVRCSCCKRPPEKCSLLAGKEQRRTLIRLHTFHLTRNRIASIKWTTESCHAPRLKESGTLYDSINKPASVQYCQWFCEKLTITIRWQVKRWKRTDKSLYIFYMKTTALAQ